MTEISSKKRERRRLQAVAKEYKDNGYEVHIYPAPAQLPQFLQGYNPDMVASSATENAVVEVKTQETLPSSNYLVPLADTISKQPGWSFELVVTNPKQAPPAEESSQLLEESEIMYRLKSVSQLVTFSNMRPPCSCYGLQLKQLSG